MPLQDSKTNAPNPTITARKIEANRENAQRSTGPRTSAGKLVVSHNAFKHGLLSKALKFQDEHEEAEFREFEIGLVEGLEPVGVVERALVEEMAVSYWKTATAEGWMMQDLQSRRRAATAILDVFINSSDSAGNPFSKQQHEVRSAARTGLDCRELIVKVGGNDAPGLVADFDLLNSPENKKAKVQFEAKLGGSADTILRYQNAWKRDFYKALETLTKLQQARKTSSVNASGAA